MGRAADSLESALSEGAKPSEKAPPMTRIASALVCLVFALSGGAALIFEALFFRLIGLVVGNGVEAVAIVLSSFMLGLALGNGLAARLGDRVERPFRAYAVLELATAASGLGLVIGLPSLPAALAGVLGLLADTPVLLDIARAAVAFGLVMIPATAMGATLPILVRALSAHDANFGRVLGRLYGWNTVGAMIGVLATTGVLLGSFGVRATGAIAASLDVAAALAILALARGREARVSASRPAPASIRGGAGLVLASAFGCGAVLLALEVVWFRLFLLFENSLEWSLAVMLAVVLAGIACGGLVASAWFRRRPDAHLAAPALAAVAGVLVAGCYGGLAAVVQDGVPRSLFWLYLGTTFPVAFLSGALFPMLGRALQARGAAESRAAGSMTLANTLGSALGSLLAGYLLIPVLGVEASIFGLALSYGVVSLLLVAAGHLGGESVRGGRALLLAVLLACWALGLLAFPFGALDARLLAAPGSAGDSLRARGFQRVVLLEGRTSTIQLFRKDLNGQAHKWTLVTDGHLMSGESLVGRRFRKLYGYLPAALHPRLRNALLISYGVGSTAESLTEQRSLEHIDIVDIAREIPEVAAARFAPGEDPLSDPRVHVHIDDGRFFLLTSERRYDLITAEPPPPRHAGVDTLYSVEYFESMRARLAPGGFASYWLPVYQLEEDETKSILAAFCAAFDNCSLWIGAGLEWMMVGVRAPYESPTLDGFTAPWRDPEQQRRLADIGLHTPAHLGALYIADGERLRRWIGEAEPLDDRHPHRLRPFSPVIAADVLRAYTDFMNSPETAVAFESSPLITRLWPESIRAETAEWFPLMRVVERMAGWGWESAIGALHASFVTPRLAPYRGWVFDSDALAKSILADVDEQSALRGELESEVNTHLAMIALERGEVARAVEFLEATLRTSDDLRGGRALLAVYLRLRMGDVDAADQWARKIARTHDPQTQARLTRVVGAFQRWFELEPSFGAAR